MSGGYVPDGEGRGRELAFGGMFGAAALVFPFFFHVLHLGHIFMPMYIPLMAMPFFVRPLTAALAGGMAPLLSALLTGMPPLFPPVAPAMAIELAAMAGGLAFLRRRWPAAPVFLHLLFVLVIGRFLNAGLLYASSLWLDLPAAFIAGISFISGWPGLILMMVVIPPIARVRTLLGGTVHG
jgi:hypothetical protein